MVVDCVVGVNCAVVSSVVAICVFASSVVAICVPPSSVVAICVVPHTRQNSNGSQEMSTQFMFPVESQVYIPGRPVQLLPNNSKEANIIMVV